MFFIVWEKRELASKLNLPIGITMSSTTRLWRKFKCLLDIYSIVTVTCSKLKGTVKFSKKLLHIDRVSWGSSPSVVCIPIW
jgi:hypothetical protein